MQVKHIGADGRVRRTFDDVGNMYWHNGSIVTINSTAMHVDKTEESTNTLPLNYTNYTYEYPIAIIHLAPGESLERVDEPARG